MSLGSKRCGGCELWHSGRIGEHRHAGSGQSRNPDCAISRWTFFYAHNRCSYPASYVQLTPKPLAPKADR